jgi:hypothetical protein
MKFSINLSWRYFVVGAYADRDKPIIRVYPCPFIRLNLEVR